MQIIADLHIHSKYSRAVSPKMDLEGISLWASKKGIQLVGTGDWTHPMWFRQIQTELTEKSPGIYTLKKKPFDQAHDVSFMLSTEIACIYSQGGKGRRIHVVVFAPSIAVAEKVNKEITKRGGNILSDGRPILGMSAKDLLSMLLEIDPSIMLIPAHIWTPWFSLFGSKSGFDSVEECFGKLASHIYGIETGLSSDPIMNWQIKDLDNRSILSSSDAHSGPKLGREATVFIPITNNQSPITNHSYVDIIQAIKQDPKGKLKIGYTIEFFPEEGKYHWSGHRACNIRMSPQDVKKNGSINCPVCHQPMTIGVENRVIDLASRVIEKKDLIEVTNSKGIVFVGDPTKTRRPFVSLVPLQEILMQILDGSPTKSVVEYERILSDETTEFDILLRLPYEEIEKKAGTAVKKAVQTMRERKVAVSPGYDGVFGTINVINNIISPSIDKTKEERIDQEQLF